MTDPRHPLESIDQVLAPLGFVRETSLGKNTWRGEHRGRTWTVSVSPQSRTRYSGDVRVRQRLGDRVRVECSTGVATRLYFVKSGFASSWVVRGIYRLRRLGAVEDVPAELAGYVAVAREPWWARALLSAPSAVDALVGLLEVPPTSNLGSSVHFEPKTAHFASGIVQLGDGTPGEVLRTIERMESLAEAAESAPPPKLPAELGVLERLARARPWLAALGVLGCVAVAGAVLSVVVLVVLLLLSRFGA